MNIKDYSSILKSVSKPGRYAGGEYGQTIKDKSKIKARFAFCFPDTYEIGMSNLGVRLLYGALNREEDIWCERAYTPWVDMQEQMAQHGLPLTTLESGDALPPQTESFVKAFANRDALLMTETLVPMEKWKRDALAEILAQWLDLLEGSLTSRAGLSAVSAHSRELARQRSAVEIYEGVQTLKKALAYTQSNVSPAAVCGWLAWTLR